MPESRFLRLLITAGSALIAFAVLFGLVYRERAVLLTYDWHLRWHFLPVGLVLFFVGLVLAAGVWADLMRSLGSPVAFTEHLRIYALSQLTKRLPGTVWYVVGRGYLYKQQGESARLVTVASSLELAITVLSGCVMTLAFAAYWLSRLPGLYWMGLVVFLVLGLALIHPTTLRWLLQRLGRSEPIQYHMHSLLRWFCCYMLIWLLGGVIFYCNANALIPIELRFLPQVIGFWCLVGTLSVVVFFLPTNLGFTEVGLSLLLSTLAPSSLAVLIAVFSRLFILVYEMLGVLFMLLILRFVDKQEAFDWKLR